tara:strand:+ start:1544 stop:2623 length:1080 start_codon:yes stop_codon:yes gene_type:complete
MNIKIKTFTFIIIIICPFILKAQNTQLGDPLIIKNHPKVGELYLKLKLPKYWKTKDGRTRYDNTIKILYNNSETNKIFMTYVRNSRSYTRAENKAIIDKRKIESFFFRDTYFYQNLTGPSIDIINQTKLTVDTYPALMIRAKVQIESMSGEQLPMFYRTAFLIFHKGLVIKFHKDSKNSSDSKNDQQLLELIIKSISFPNKNSDEKIEGVICKICSDIMVASRKAYDIPKWQKTMQKELGYDGTEEDFSKYFNNFLNKYKNQIICPEFKVTTNVYPPQHLFKRLLAAGMNETYEEYFFNFEDGDVDFNAYQIIDGKKETILDWVEHWIAEGLGDPEELRDIASGLRDEFGAKYGKELPD